jgi:hypothetical protein
MIDDLAVASIQIQEGRAKALVAFKYGKKIDHHLFEFPLNENPELDALVPIINDAIRAVLAKRLGIVKNIVTPANA